MRIRFNGGPWDGPELHVTYFPDKIAFKDLDVRVEKLKGKAGTFDFHTAKREHHVYISEEPRILEGVELEVGVNLKREPEEGENIIEVADSSIIVMHYRYAPNEKLDWEE